MKTKQDLMEDKKILDLPGSFQHVCGGREVREVNQDTSRPDTVITKQNPQTWH